MACRRRTYGGRTELEASPSLSLLKLCCVTLAGLRTNEKSPCALRPRLARSLCAVACSVVHEVHVVTWKTYTPQLRVRQEVFEPAHTTRWTHRARGFALAFAFEALLRDACRTSNQREKSVRFAPSLGSHSLRAVACPSDTSISITFR